MSHTGKRVEDMKDTLKKGYIEMSRINLEESNLSVHADNEALDVCEKQLSECE